MKTSLEDTDPMPFGKYKGCPMQEVPASYLHYLWCNGVNKELGSLLHKYIKDNMNALKQENTDKIWE